MALVQSDIRQGSQDWKITSASRGLTDFRSGNGSQVEFSSRLLDVANHVMPEIMGSAQRFSCLSLAL